MTQPTPPLWQLSPQELAQLIDTMPEPHIVFDTEYRVIAANTSYLKAFETSGPVIGRRCYEVSHQYAVPCDQAGESCPMAQAMTSHQRERVLHLHHTPQGEQYVNIVVTPLITADGKINGFIERMDPILHAHHEAHASGLTGQSQSFQGMLQLMSRVAPSDASVLLLGETGTGKELVAHAIHTSSARHHKTFVAVDCSSLTESLFESELFGHERGAFTDAHRAKVGLVETAHEGTLFLDEVGDIPLSMQVKLLRLLETGTYRRVGSTELRHADVRIVSATHRDLPTMVEQGLFRRDLYHRLSTFPIWIPALRDRLDDMGLLVEALLKRLAPQRLIMVDEDAITWLQSQNFSGNIRELRNLLERTLLLMDHERIDRHILQKAQHMGLSPFSANHLSATQTTTLKSIQTQALNERVLHFQGSNAELAKELGISERTLYRKIKLIKEKN